jgi:hypothetical protein
MSRIMIVIWRYQLREHRIIERPKKGNGLANAKWRQNMPASLSSKDNEITKALQFYV